jgi:hypothetical protein
MILLDVLGWFGVCLCATGLTMMKMDNVITITGLLFCFSYYYLTTFMRVNSANRENIYEVFNKINDNFHATL